MGFNRYLWFILPGILFMVYVTQAAPADVKKDAFGCALLSIVGNECGSDEILKKAQACVNSGGKVSKDGKVECCRHGRKFNGSCKIPGETKKKPAKAPVEVKNPFANLHNALGEKIKKDQAEKKKNETTTSTIAP